MPSIAQAYREAYSEVCESGMSFDAAADLVRERYGLSADQTNEVWQRLQSTHTHGHFRNPNRKNR